MQRTKDELMRLVNYTQIEQLRVYSIYKVEYAALNGKTNVEFHYINDNKYDKTFIMDVLSKVFPDSTVMCDAANWRRWQDTNIPIGYRITVDWG